MSTACSCFLCRSEIKYKAEGLKNVVFGLHNKEINHKVIRIRKRKKYTTDLIKEEDARRIHNQEQIFYSKVMQRLITPKYCLPIQSVTLDTNSKIKLQQELEISKSRRANRFVKLTEIDCKFPFGFMMDDHTLSVPNFLQKREQNHQESSIFCIEIKPKSGHVFDSTVVQSQSQIKRKTCAYCLRQMLKVAKGEVDEQSYYCPTDLFSKSEKRITKALNFLLQNPQNNFKIFYQGNLCFTGKLGGKHEQMNIQRLDDLDELLSRTLFDFPNKSKINSRDNFVSLLCSIIMKEYKLFEIIEEIQSRDYFNIENIYPFYLRVKEMNFFDELEEFCLSPHENDLIPFTIEEQSEIQSYLHMDVSELRDIFEKKPDIKYKLFHVIKDFLLAASLKDCSIMITLIRVSDNYEQQQQQQHQFDSSSLEDNWASISIPFNSCNLFVYYRIAIIDVDPKPLCNIPKYSEQDNTMIQNAKNVMQGTSFTTPCATV